MIFKLLKRSLKNLGFAHQILIIQIITIGLILTILSAICFLLINQFKLFVQDELVESVIQKSVVSSIKSIVGQSLRQTLIISQQQNTLFAAYNDLYNFQLSNNIKMIEPIEECNNTFILNCYKFCYHGQFDQEDQESQQFQQFISLQNTIVPFRLNSEKQTNFYKQYYNMLLSDQVLYTLQVGKQKPSIDENLSAVYYYLKKYNLMLMLNQIQQGDQMLVYIFYVFPETRIAFGTLNDIAFPIYVDNKILKIRAYLVLENGLILTDTQSAAKGQYFQNVSGFTNLQFELIKNKTLGMKVKNECEQLTTTFCLFNDQKLEKFVFSQYFLTEQIQYVIIVTDGSFINLIRDEFNKELNNFINLQIQMLVGSLFFILIISVPIQAILIIKLRRPQNQLLAITKYNINHNQYKFETLIRIKDRNQMQLLQDAYFDLINQTKDHNNNHIKQYENNNLYFHKLGHLQRREEFRVTRILKNIISSIK